VLISVDNLKFKIFQREKKQKKQKAKKAKPRKKKEGWGRGGRPV
jgi:hypothetical protein